MNQTGESHNIEPMGFLSSIVGAVVKTALTPVAVVVDVAKVAVSVEPDTTKNLVKEAVKDAEDAMDSITGG